MSSEESSIPEVRVAPPDELERIRNEEYKIWKKQSPFLYDICISKALQSPSASVQWYPAGASADPASPFTSYQLLLTSAEIFGGGNTVFTATCDLPGAGADAEAISRLSADKKNSLNVVNTNEVHALGPGEFPLKARYSPLNSQLVAVGGKDGFLKVFDGGEPTALTHHTQTVYDVAWSPHKAQELVSVGADGTAALWDISQTSRVPRVFAGSNAPGYGESVAQSINAVQFAPLNANELVTAGDDREIRLWDLRTPLTDTTRVIKEAHATGITALDYSRHNEMLLATGSADGTVALWDVRMSSASLLGVQADAGPVNALRWSPHDESVFATGGADAQVKVWDLSMHGQPQTQAEEEEGPPELIFVHGGHLNSISDLSWHPTLDWTICSVSEDSLVGVWKIASAIVDADEEKD